MELVDLLCNSETLASRLNELYEKHQLSTVSLTPARRDEGGEEKDRGKKKRKRDTIEVPSEPNKVHLKLTGYNSIRTA